MSGQDEKDGEEDKITVLFPEKEESDPEEGDLQEGDGPGEEAGDVVDAEEDSSEEAEVVRLDFGGEERRSLREVVAEAEESDVDVERTKYEVFRRMIDEGMVMVTLDTRFSSVDVPPQFEGMPELRLNFSHLFHIDDFDYDEQGVRASLSFEGKRQFCDIAWEAVFMLYSHETGDVVVFEPGEPS